MRLILAASIACAIAAPASLLLARVHPFGDAGLHPAMPAQSYLLEHSSVPPAVRATLIAKCADCHSLQPRSPIYSRFAPVSWLMERDILAARSRMNLSLWDTYSPDQQQVFAAEILQQAKTHQMPLLQYRIIHWNTHITNADLQTLTQWAHTTSAADPDDARSTAQSTAEGDPVRGKEVFEKRCTGCHAMEQDREGPHLKGVYGRTSGTVSSFTYSPALKNTHIVWNETTLEQWLTDPDTLVPNNNMDFHVPKPQERHDLVSFLKQSR